MHLQQALTLRNGPELVDNFYLLFPFMAKAVGVGCFIWSYKELDFFRFLILSYPNNPYLFNSHRSL